MLSLRQRGQRPGLVSFVRSRKTKPQSWQQDGSRMKRLVSIPRDGFHDMREMIFHLPLRNAEELRKLVGGQPGAGQEPDHALAHRL